MSVASNFRQSARLDANGDGFNDLMVDLAVEFAQHDAPGGRAPLPVLVVARQSLGTINHTLLTIEAARHRGLEVAGVIFNGLDDSTAGIAERTNPDVIAKASGVPILGILPYLPELEAAEDPVACIREAALQAIDLAALRGAVG